MPNQEPNEKFGEGRFVGTTKAPRRYADVLVMPAFRESVSDFLIAFGESETIGAGTFRARDVSPVDSDVVKLLLQQNQDDRNRITTLEREVAELRNAVGLESPEVRKISRAQARKEIKSYFEQHDGETLFPSDLSEALELDYDLIVKLIDELETKGQIAKA